ncbi:MAG TPA: hypothetical protein VFL94_00910 [Actinomycetales bacterium]|nr:hypothetical protein [Actinomycetales bacterium]
MSAASALLLTVWVGYFTALQWSVVRYRLGIVVVVTAAAVLLGTALVRGWRPPAVPRGLLAAGLLSCALVTEAVPFFSYTTPGERRALAHVTAVGCVLAAAALALPDGRRARPQPRAVAAAIAVLTFIAGSAAAILLDRAPRIDVWVTLQQASDGLARGQNMYTMTWHDSPGIQDAFTYLPWTAVLVAPARWLVGDVRWALLLLAVVALACMAALGRGRRGALTAVTLLAVAPGTITQSEQAWTEPMLLAAIAGWALLVRRGHAWWAVVPLAVGCASKQHLAVLLPVLACWQAFGWRRVVATAGLSGVLVLPWFVADPAAMWHDTVSLLVGFHPIRFANTLYLAARHELGWTPPFWLTGLVVLAVLVTACVAVRRRQPDLTELLGWLALVLLVATLVNKQGFYNQYWLVGGLVALSLAASGGEVLDRLPRENPAQA